MALMSLGYAGSAAGFTGIPSKTSTRSTKVVTIEGVAPSVATVKKYPYSRPTYLYTNGEPTGTTKAFIDFCLSAAGDSIVGKVGFVPKSLAQ